MSSLPNATPNTTPNTTPSTRRATLMRSATYASVGVAVGLVGVDRGQLDLGMDHGRDEVVADVDRPVEVVEPAADLGDHEMAAHELDGSVGAVELIDAGDGNEPVVVGPEHAHSSIGHGDQLPSVLLMCPQYRVIAVTSTKSE